MTSKATEPVTTTTVESPLGPLTMVARGARLVSLEMQGQAHAREVPIAAVADDRAFSSIATQLEEYFAGHRKHFDIELGLEGSTFQLRVWEELSRIPYGHTISYGQLAARVGRPGAARAVGLANGRNPVAIIVPCHRVIGADGNLTGYGGGLWRKEFLLGLEGAHPMR